MKETLKPTSLFETTSQIMDRMSGVRFKVLVADDSAADQLLAERRLGRSSCLQLVAAVSSGQMAKDYLAGEGKYANRTLFPFPDLLLLDVDMPGMGGLEVLEWARGQNYQQLRIVMLSGSVDPTSVARSFELGADYFQSKNSNPAELNFFVRRLEFLMVLLANLEPKAPSPSPKFIMNKILKVVDGRGPPWKQALVSAAQTGQNFVLILNSEQDLEKLWSTLGTTSVVPDRLQRWGLLALSEALTTEDFDLLQACCKESSVYLVEQITLNCNVPPNTKRFLLYCELRGIISDHDTVEEAGLSLLNYLSGFKMARLLPLAGIYDHARGKWERVKKLTSA